MKFDQPLIEGTLIQRYKRFLADARLSDGSVVTAHCPNSGSMLSCNLPGSRILLSRSNNPRRKLSYTWELIQVDSVWVGINTNVPNRLVYEALVANQIPELRGYDSIRREVKYGENSRIDLLLEREQDLCFIEVKNVTLVENGVAYFPDAVTQRGTKHLHELMAMVRQGHRAIMFYLIQRKDGRLFKPADSIDPVYGQTLRKAISNGVEILAYQAEVTPWEIRLGQKVRVSDL
ncbi:MAG: DNA/RNA nuclease SfsA [candidate division KSB1 bacterium]|nr:DNA/RNA nuclease SfsA [candidate division KSB1 bacterium]